MPIQKNNFNSSEQRIFMKNIVALGICLAAFNVYAQDIDNRPNQEMSSITIDAQTRQVADEKMVTTESAVQETYPVTMKNANGENKRNFQLSRSGRIFSYKRPYSR
jgi:hypothetical protein